MNALTCHLAHWDGDHLAWDLAMFVALGLLLEARGRARLSAALAIGSLCVSMAVLLGAPGVTTYRGLTGIDSLLFVLALFALRHEGGPGLDPPWRTALLAALALGLAAKLGYECASGQTLFVGSDAFTPVPLAHVGGAAAGVVMGLVADGASRSAGTRASVPGFAASRGP